MAGPTSGTARWKPRWKPSASASSLPGAFQVLQSLQRQVEEVPRAARRVEHRELRSRSRNARYRCSGLERRLSARRASWRPPHQAISWRSRSIHITFAGPSPPFRRRDRRPVLPPRVPSSLSCGSSRVFALPFPSSSLGRPARLGVGHAPPSSLPSSFAVLRRYARVSGLCRCLL